MVEWIDHRHEACAHYIFPVEFYPFVTSATLGISFTWLAWVDMSPDVLLSWRRLLPMAGLHSSPPRRRVPRVTLGLSFHNWRV